MSKVSSLLFVLLASSAATQAAVINTHFRPSRAISGTLAAGLAARSVPLRRQDAAPGRSLEPLSLLDNIPAQCDPQCKPLRTIQDICKDNTECSCTNANLELVKQCFTCFVSLEADDAAKAERTTLLQSALDTTVQGCATTDNAVNPIALQGATAAVIDTGDAKADDAELVDDADIEPSDEEVESIDEEEEIDLVDDSETIEEEDEVDPVDETIEEEVEEEAVAELEDDVEDVESIENVDEVDPEVEQDDEEETESSAAPVPTSTAVGSATPTTITIEIPATTLAIPVDGSEDVLKTLTDKVVDFFSSLIPV